MKSVYSLVLCLIIIILSCCEEKKPVQKIEEIETTPEVFENEDSSSSIYNSRSSGGDYSDIITKLYNEALEKDPELKNLDEMIHSMYTKKSDSLSEIRAYQNNNMEYWHAAYSLINTMSDTNLVNTTFEMFTRLEDKYKSSMMAIDGKQEKIENMHASLHDKLILLKLAITYKMMKNYQQNEMPGTKPLYNLIKDYDRLFKQIDKYIKY